VAYSRAQRVVRQVSPVLSAAARQPADTLTQTHGCRWAPCVHGSCSSATTLVGQEGPRRGAPAVVGALRPRVPARRPAERPLGRRVEQRVLLQHRRAVHRSAAPGGPQQGRQALLRTRQTTGHARGACWSRTSSRPASECTLSVWLRSITCTLRLCLCGQQGPLQHWAAGNTHMQDMAASAAGAPAQCQTTAPPWQLSPWPPRMRGACWSEWASCLQCACRRPCRAAAHMRRTSPGTAVGWHRAASSTAQVNISDSARAHQNVGPRPERILPQPGTAT